MNSDEPAVFFLGMAVCAVLMVAIGFSVRGCNHGGDIHGVVKSVRYAPADVKKVYEPRGQGPIYTEVQDQPVTIVEFEDGRKAMFVGVPYKPVPVGSEVDLSYDIWYRISDVRTYIKPTLEKPDGGYQ